MPNQDLDSPKNTGRLRLSLLMIAIAVILAGAFLWLLSMRRIVDDTWAPALAILFTVSGVIFTLCQWLLPVAPLEFKAKLPRFQTILNKHPPSSTVSPPLVTTSTKHLDYDVAISYAEEDHDCADALAIALQNRGINIFYDKYEKSTLWGKNLYDYLSDLYQNRARYCVMLISKHYAAKLWTNREREAAQARALHEHGEFILPVRLDDTAIPGLLPTLYYLRWPPENAETIANIIVEKINSI